MRVMLIITGLLLTLIDVYAQEKNKNIEKIKEDADSYFDYQDYRNALNLYREAYKLDSSDTEIAYKTGVCMYNLKKYKKQAIPFFEKAVKGEEMEAYFYLGNLYHLTLRFNEAIKAYHYYKTYNGEKKVPNVEIDRLIAEVLYAEEAMKKPVDARVWNIGSVINSKYPDYVPLISADESMLIFTSRREESTTRQLDPNGEYFEDVYVSYKKDNGLWSSPKSISSNINTPTHDACVTLSIDGKKLIIYRNNAELTGGDLYLSKYVGEDWTPPEKLSMEVNTKGGWVPSASLSADEQMLYFASNRPGGYGGKDIYKVVLLPNGEWSKATNLGPIINTSYDEDAPYIHPDGRTLYFSSKGHKNMGGYDIFKVSLDNDGMWTEPKNIGFPINSVDDDIYFILSADGKKGYYSSNKIEGYGETDIYVIDMPVERFNWSIIRGVVVDDSTRKPISASITLIDEKSKDVQGIYSANAFTGKYLLVVSPNRTYKMLIESEGYYPYSEYIHFSDEQIFMEIETGEITLQKK